MLKFILRWSIRCVSNYQIWRTYWEIIDYFHQHKSYFCTSKSIAGEEQAEQGIINGVYCKFIIYNAHNKQNIILQIILKR
jgi:hypothetical protein